MNAGAHHSEDKLLDYAYGELTANEAAAVDAHLRSCTKCGQALAQIRSVRQTFAPLPMEAAPDAGLESLLAYAEQHARRSRAPAAPWRRWVFGLASVAGLLVVGVVGLQASKEAPQSAAEVVAKTDRADRQAEEARVKDLAPVAAGVAEQWEPQAALANEKGAEAPAPLEATARKKLSKLNEPYKESGKRGLKPLEDARPAAPADDEARTFDDYGNAGRKVGLLEAKDAKEEARREVNRDARATAKADGFENTFGDQLNDGTSVKQSMGGSAGSGRFGLGSGPSGSVVTPRPMQAEAVVDRAPNEKAQADKAKSPAPPPPPVQAAPPQAQMPSYDAPAPAPAKKVSSYGLPRSAPAPESAEADSDPSPKKSRTQSGDVEAELSRARTAAGEGDLQTVVQAAVRALSAGATGYQRAEALKRACDGFEALGQLDRAEGYCEQLLKEFSSTVAARQVAERRLKAATKARTKKAADSAADAPASAY